MCKRKDALLWTGNVVRTCTLLTLCRLARGTICLLVGALAAAGSSSLETAGERHVSRVRRVLIFCVQAIVGRAFISRATARASIPRATARVAPTIHELQLHAFGFDDLCDTSYETFKWGRSKGFVGAKAYGHCGLVRFFV